MKFEVAEAAGGEGQFVPLAEYRALVEHHTETERLATALAEAAKDYLREVAVRAGTRREGRLRAAVEAFDAHQWPEV